MKSFIINVLILSGIWAAVGLLGFHFFFAKYYFTAFPFVFLVFSAVSIYTFSLLLRSNSQQPEKFNMNFTLSFLLKLFVYAAFVGIGIYIDPENAKIFTVYVLVTYLIYTVFDTKAIVKAIRD